MEIYYIHINGYKQYKDTDINFGGEYRFFYDPQSKNLRVEENQHYIKDFFKSSISNGNSNQAIVNKVSCVVGENGVGKSSLLNFIKSNLIRGVSRVQYPIIIAFKTSDNEKIIYYFEDKTPVKKHNCSDYGFTLSKLKIKEELGPDTPIELKNIDFIFASNVFDNSSEIELNGLFNLSTNFLIKNDKKRLVQNHITQNYVNEVDTHRVEDVIRQVNFIHSYKDVNRFINFELPEILSFKVKFERDFLNNSNAKSFIDNSSKVENPNLSFIETLINKAKEEIKNSNDARENTLTNFYTNCIINFLYEIHNIYGSASKEISFTFSDLISQFVFSNKYHKDLLKLVTVLKQESKKIPPSLDKVFYDWISGIENYFNILNKVIKIDALQYHITNIGSAFQIDIKDSFEKAEKIITAYNNTFQLTPHLDFEWRGMSSGQSALFNIYSRLYTLNDSQTVNKLNKDVFLMIDEADTYMHPRWSQTMVQSIINFVSDIYTSSDITVQRQIQIIFTSNSPFIAADIPSSNVVFLKKEKTKKNKYIVVAQKSLEDKKETFGANIHTLLLDSFFLPLGALGDFAKNKIENIIERLNSPKPYSNAEEKEELRKTIGIIGEPVIKRKLLQMYNDRFNIDIDDRIKNLEQEIGRLNKSK